MLVDQPTEWIPTGQRGPLADARNVNSFARNRRLYDNEMCANSDFAKFNDCFGLGCRRGELTRIPCGKL